MMRDCNKIYGKTQCCDISECSTIIQRISDQTQPKFQFYNIALISGQFSSKHPIKLVQVFGTPTLPQIREEQSAGELRRRPRWCYSWKQFGMNGADVKLTSALKQDSLINTLIIANSQLDITPKHRCTLRGSENLFIFRRKKIKHQKCALLLECDVCGFSSGNNSHN